VGATRPEQAPRATAGCSPAQMPALNTLIVLAWLLFSGYWFVSALGAKHGRRAARARAPALAIAVAGFLAVRLLSSGSLAVHSPVLQAAGVILLGCGLGVAVWARVCLGRNWGMPMTQKDEPELVTSGPYRKVRHPIYSGILLAVLGTSLATSLYGLLALVVLGAYFIYSARVEEGQLTSSFPTTYPRYRTRTKMLIPFVL
jgi:protein-S-isoprenylcysteine O-methyltransferase Ste14